MKRIQSNPAARTRRTLARSAVLLALALAAPASARTLAPGVLFEVTYAYDSLGRPASRTVNGELQTFEYDGRDRLVAVRAEDGSDIERYRYDAAGDILEKTVRGETTRFVYDAANQLVSRTDGSGTTAFAYDAAGRLVREGDRRFVYGNDGHVSRVLEGGAVVASFDYFLDGQVAAVHARGRTERFLWDGLAMVARGDRTFLNEPAATGGNPVASMGRSFLNDMLGSTVGVHDRKARARTAVSMTLFGETDADEAYFTGKPALPELGYAFLVRSYRADLGKWQTRDPFGYPDGWNAMAYCGNRPSISIDLFGALTVTKDDDFWEGVLGGVPFSDWEKKKPWVYIGESDDSDIWVVTTKTYDYYWESIAGPVSGPGSGVITVSYGNTKTTTTSEVESHMNELGGSIGATYTKILGVEGRVEYSRSWGGSTETGSSESFISASSYSDNVAAGHYATVWMFQEIRTITVSTWEIAKPTSSSERKKLRKMLAETGNPGDGYSSTIQSVLTIRSDELVAAVIDSALE